MKILICVAVMTCAICAMADEQGYLTGTNSIELAEGESLIVLSIIKASYNGEAVSVEIPPNGGTWYRPKLYSDSDLAQRTILGPCNVKLSNPSINIVAYKTTSNPVFTNPVNVIMIPADYNGNVDLMVETSADLETWTPIYSASAGTSNSAAYYRTRLITQ